MSRKAWLIVIGVAVVGGVLALRQFRKSGEEPPKFRKEKVEVGDVVQSVTASGSLSAVTTVKVGSQVSGIISSLHADFNSQVSKGQLLAELDEQPFQAAVDQREADLERSRAEWRDAQRELARAKRLREEGILAQGELDAAIARHDSASAVVRQGEAALRQARVNLENCRITSPIDGVVVDRQYDIGQTVAASFQAPTLFTIAKDLTRMQVLTNIDEADIGGVRTDQAATFTVDAFPDETFRGVVSQVRLSAQTVQNVVTYPVVVDVDNADARLKPGMTANVAIPVASRQGVLRVPNAALRFRPDPSLIVKPEKAASGIGGASAGPGRGPAASGPAAEAGEAGPGVGAARGAGRGGRPSGPWEGRRSGGPGGAPGGVTGGPPMGPGGEGPGGSGGGAWAKVSRGATVYVEAEGGKLRAVAVRTSITDGASTAVESSELKEGDEVVVGLATTRVSGQGGGRPPGMGGPGGGGMRGPRM